MIGRKPICPGLQEAIEDCFLKHKGEHLSTKELQRLVLAEMELRELEREQVEKCFPNYVTRAVRKGVLLSQGRRKGYVINVDF